MLYSESQGASSTYLKEGSTIWGHGLFASKSALSAILKSKPTGRFDTARRNRRSNSTTASSSDNVGKSMQKWTIVEGRDVKRVGPSLKEYKFTFNVWSFGVRGMIEVSIKPVNVSRYLAWAYR